MMTRNLTKAPGHDRGNRWRGWLAVVAAGALLGCSADAQQAVQPLTAPDRAAPATQQPTVKQNQDIVLQVGVVQRFGRDPKETLTLTAPAGDRLTLRFKTGDKAETVTSTQVKLDIVMQPLPEPITRERVVLSTHRSFESAEESANRWRAQGIPVEVGQPDRWQVWAKREVYNDPTVRRLLLQSLHDAGHTAAFIDAQPMQQRPRASFVVNGYRYTRDHLEISAGKSVIQVKQAGARASDRRYGGTLRLQPNTYGTYTLVNAVPLETYLRGVVPHEIGVWPPQAVLEVQAILARTYALRNLRRFAIDDYQLCADTQCQVYKGLGGAHPATDRAIAATKGLVLTYENELVDAVYSSTTGGITAPFQDVWDGPERPYLRAVVDSVAGVWNLSQYPLDNEANFRRFIQLQQGFNEARQSNYFRWQTQATLAELQAELKEFLVDQKSPLAQFKTIQKLAVTRRSPAGRVQELTVTTDVGPVVLNKDNLLKVFQAPNSTLFYIDPLLNAQKQLKGYKFVGGGLGHGVGLSQTGTYHLGELGWTSDRILQFYYPGTTLQKIHAGITFWRDPREAAQQAQTNTKPPAAN